MTKGILLVGVGGQGAILTSKILTSGLMRIGYDVKMSEIHGMSQRGGSVTTQIRYGEKVYSPNLGIGEADLIVSFEKLEALRALPYLKKGGYVVTDFWEIAPLPVLIGEKDYPHDAISAIEESGAQVAVVHAMDSARLLGSPRAQNIVLLGALVRQLGLEAQTDWEQIIAETVPPKTAELNLTAFRAGMRD